MKKLIFLSIFAFSAVTIAQTSQREVPTTADGQAIVSQIKDVEVTQMISETAEFRECREKYPFVASDTDAKRSQKLQAAETCFKEKLKNNTDPDKLKKLSEALNLQSYKLVKGNSSKEIQEYLTNKMVEALTGVDPAEKNEQELKESLKVENRKIVDQSIFIQLYKTQLGKNALFEISRFCFENLRNNNPPPNSTNFINHWSTNTTFSDINPADPATIQAAVASVNDFGNEKFGSFTDTTDKSKIYGDIFKSIQGNAGPEQKQNIQQFIKSYFLNCGILISPLCDKFKNRQNPSIPTNSQLGIGLTTPPSSTPATGTTSGQTNASNPTSTPSNEGAAACLTLNRIREYKIAIANTDKVAKYFDEQMQGGNNLSQFMKGLNGEPIKIFGSGSDSQEATIDDLTNNTASSILQGDLADQLAQDKAKECEESPELSKCEGFVYQTEELNKIKQKIELDQTLKREVEMERVRKLVEGDRQDLETYLKENGFFDILNSPDYENMNKDNLVAAVGKSFEAKKLAMLNEINTRLGSRQVKDENELETFVPGSIDTIKQDSKEERARLAQVVLFNNIITSHLSLKKRESSGEESEVGRNLGAWRKEERALGRDQVDTSLFENLKATDPNGGNGGGIGRDAQIADFSLLDDILGKKE